MSTLQCRYSDATIGARKFNFPPQYENRANQSIQCPIRRDILKCDFRAIQGGYSLILQVAFGDVGSLSFGHVHPKKHLDGDFTLSIVGMN